ncbi:hypothetical protein [Sorangium sp. So ce1335]|uniref:hypothetical protein n=1 Tax=Sorangium sp. So ce1335 TaxID=3133335 RepID=UPI003F5E473E
MKEREPPWMGEERCCSWRFTCRRGCTAAGAGAGRARLWLRGAIGVSVLWIAAMQLRDEPVPFLVARSGRPLGSERPLSRTCAQVRESISLFIYRAERLLGVRHRGGADINAAAGKLDGFAKLTFAEVTPSVTAGSAAWHRPPTSADPIGDERR